MNRHALLVFAVLLASAPALHAQLRDVDRDKAIQDIKKLNGQYQIDNNRADKPIVAVYLEGASVLDRDIESLAPLHRLQRLLLVNTALTDKGMDHIKGLTTLQELSLVKAKVTDKGLEQLGKLSALQTLDLTGTLITDDGLDILKKFPDLRRLTLQ